MLDAVGGLVLALGSAKTNTYNSAAINTQYTAYPQPFWAKFFYDTVLNVSGNAKISFTVDWSDDGSTWTTAGIENLVSQSDVILTTSTTAQYGAAFAPILTTHQYIRANIVFSSTTGTPSGNFGIYIVSMLQGPRAD